MKLALTMLYGRSDRHELRQIRAPFVSSDLEPHSDDAVRIELICLFLHARHRELSGMVGRLSQNLHFLVLLPIRLLIPDVVDGAPYHQAKGIKTGLLDEQELVDGEIAGEEVTGF